MKISSPKSVAAAAIAAALALPFAHAQAADTTSAATATSTSPSKQGLHYSDRDHMKSWSGEQEQLEQSLRVGASKGDYRRLLADKGYTITAINQDESDYVEYEVVKGDHSFEVQIDLDKKTGLGSKVDVDRNQWRADATKEALRSGRAVTASKRLTDGNANSDRANSKGWTDQKGRLEKRLTPGKDLAFYTDELKKMGYQITSTNDKDKNYVEYEIVKGRDSYEVQMDLDLAGKARQVDVTSNLWQAEATEKALSQTQ